MEIHSIDTCDNCWRHENDRSDRDYFYDLILLDINKSERGVLKVSSPLCRNERFTRNPVGPPWKNNGIYRYQP
jgi:hypothetical protein